MLLQLQLRGVADRVNLGLIPSSEDAWPVACQVLKPSGGILHVHGNVNIRTGDGEKLIPSGLLRANNLPVTNEDMIYRDLSVSKDSTGHFNRACNNVQVTGLDCEFTFTDQSTGAKEKCLESNDDIPNSNPNCKSSEGSVVCLTELDKGVSAYKMQAWQQWGGIVCQRLSGLLEKVHGGLWVTNLLHIERIKSYAPYVDHIVLDIQCCPHTVT